MAATESRRAPTATATVRDRDSDSYEYKREVGLDEVANTLHIVGVVKIEFRIGILRISKVIK